jgi:quinol monooxygenase YgiN
MTNPIPIRHIVLFKFNADATAAVVAELSRAFAALPHLIEGVTAFEAGENNSPEGLNRGFTHAFTLTFVDAAARDHYLPHPQHQAFVERLKPFLEDVLVIDYALA